LIRWRGRGALLYGELWFDEEALDDEVDVLLYRRRRAPLAGHDNQSYQSLVTALDVAEDEIAARLDETCGYQVRRAEQRDELQLYASPDPAADLERFRAFFDAFAAQKSLAPSDGAWLAAACAAGQLALTAAEKEGEVLVWHAYLRCATTASLHHSASWFRQGDKAYRALVGRANRWLHWRSMRWFREAGLRRYDWGGLFDDDSTPERAGINRFKRSFGGTPERRYDCTLPRSVRGRVLVPLRDAWRRLKATPALRNVIA
jgi:hypothetical protein